MTTLENIVRELASVPEPLLLRVLSFIRLVKGSAPLATDASRAPRIPGLHEGQVWMSEDFNDPLPDSFWLGDDE
ncbi:DUF2281 domain-containing protein [Nodosilinea sp. PGN35]|uniref:hypothetical protein n=1 Tax=Nodosilinea sp. PGN35 TaxID=3020489 RepID=UPI0023B2BAFE|nr:hypothetical protein [Nodosilinea sp. TSF1-S3]MDF0365741.1 hypothetical protein [Nodosilinea sp. TSF1-S3]